MTFIIYQGKLLHKVCRLIWRIFWSCWRRWVSRWLGMGIWRYRLRLRMIRALIGMIVILIILWSELIRSLSKICIIRNPRRRKRRGQWGYILIEGKKIDQEYRIRKISKGGNLIVLMRKTFPFLLSIIPLRKRWKRKRNSHECLKINQTNKRKKSRKKQRELQLPSEKVKNHKYNIQKNNSLILIYKLRIKGGLVFFKECKKYTI